MFYKLEPETPQYLSFHKAREKSSFCVDLLVVFLFRVKSFEKFSRHST